MRVNEVHADSPALALQQQHQETEQSSNNATNNNVSTIVANVVQENKGQGTFTQSSFKNELQKFLQEMDNANFSDVEPESEFHDPENNRLSVEPVTQYIGKITSGSSVSRKRSNGRSGFIRPRKSFKKTDGREIELSKGRYQDPRPPLGF